ncbi:MAG: hypothetical protein KJO85_06485 [Gammaproteobacteria bacterium]|nr:hypothetical protein [Gammaproteobacteria bacterium]
MNQNRNRLVLLLIFLLFATPVVVAIVMHTSWWPYQPDETVNRGTLVEPPRHLDYSTLAFSDGSMPPTGKWVVVYPVSSPCTGSCMQNVEDLRQIHKATGRRQNMLAMLPLFPKRADPGQIEDMLRVYSSFVTAVDINGSGTALLARVGDLTADGDLIDGQVFLADPSGNIMMRYEAGYDPSDMNEDLKRLLKWSPQDG